MTLEEELEMLEAAYRSVVSGGVVSYTIGGRQVTKHTLGPLVARIDQVRAALARQRAGGAFTAVTFRDAE